MADYQSYKKLQGGLALAANSVGPGQVSGVSTGVAHQFFLYDCCWYDADNGGCCLLWTVPAQTTTVRFELTGGGGSGCPGACCTNGPAGGSGAFAIKTLHSYRGDFTAGTTQFTVCAGGTTSCSCCGQCHGNNCCGRRGCRSYVTGGNLSNFCVDGGIWGFHMCGELGCYSCSHIQQCDTCLLRCAHFCGTCRANAGEGGIQASSHDWGVQGVSGHRKQNHYCQASTHNISGTPVSPWAAYSSSAVDNCSHGNQQGCCKGHTMFPAGGGHSPFTDGSCCWGSWGGGGLVVVSYWQ